MLQWALDKPPHSAKHLPRKATQVPNTFPEKLPCGAIVDVGTQHLPRKATLRFLGGMGTQHLPRKATLRGEHPKGLAGGHPAGCFASTS
jgi:hypothetical protein